MQFKVLTFITLVSVIVGVANTAPLPQITDISLVKREGSVTFISSWIESALRRYRFDAYGVSDLNEFVHAFQGCGGITSNWQAWWDGDHGVFDDSEVQGPVGYDVIRCGIAAVTGQEFSCQDLGAC